MELNVTYAGCVAIRVTIGNGRVKVSRSDYRWSGDPWRQDIAYDHNLSAEVNAENAVMAYLVGQDANNGFPHGTWALGRTANDEFHAVHVFGSIDA